MSMIDRIQVRIQNIDTDLAEEFIKTAKDRILLRVGTKQTVFPAELESICVEVVHAMYNKHQMKHQGVESESVDVFSVKFINRLLDEYEPELDEYRRMYKTEQDDSLGKLRFL